MKFYYLQKAVTTTIVGLVGLSYYDTIKKFKEVQEKQNKQVKEIANLSDKLQENSNIISKTSTKLNDIQGELNKHVKEIEEVDKYLYYIQITQNKQDKEIKSLPNKLNKQRLNDQMKFEETISGILQSQNSTNKYLENFIQQSVDEGSRNKYDTDRRFEKLKYKTKNQYLEHKNSFKEIKELKSKLEQVNKTIEKITLKVRDNNKIDQEDKEALEAKLKDINERLQSLDLQNDYDKRNLYTISTKLNKLESESRVTIDRLNDIEDDLDETHDKSEMSNTNINVHYLTQITYDNPLLNHPELFKSSLKLYSLNQILDLSKSLSPELVADAINNNDDLIILGGFISLQ